MAEPYSRIGDTIESYSVLKHVYGMPPADLYLATSTPSALLADPARALAICVGSKCSQNQTPKYLYLDTVSNTIAPHLNTKSVHGLFLLRKCTMLVLDWFTDSRQRLHQESRTLSWCWRSSSVSQRMTTSSAYIRTLTELSPRATPLPVALSSVARSLMYKSNRSGDNRQPCLTRS